MASTPVDPPSTNADHRIVEDLVARCILAFESDGDAGIAAIVGEHPSHAREIRARLDDLKQHGLLVETTTSPETIGPYRILERIGRGGMGSVYLAEQREPVARRVAIKVIRPGMDSQEVLTRFAVERQALAVMNHPGIAKVLDAGLTDAGRPFFAMEYVAGIPLTEYCARRDYDIPARIRLLIEVCDAVQHAHHKGVIHRDLKPSNILVTEIDGCARIKIIDFGVAKAAHTNLQAPSLHTVVGCMLGTPEYMSPEQAGRDELDVDTRTDVYSLGVLLFELLTGELPFSSERLRSSGSAGIRRILEEEDPLAPSKQLRTSTLRRASRPTTPADATKAKHVLDRELDWITLRALEKDRNRRYGTPSELAQDLERYLANEAVVASPSSRAYRFTKFVRRNRLQVTAATTVFLALAAGLVVSLIYQSKARQSQADERTARELAETHFQQAREAVDAMLKRVADEDLADIPGMEEVRKDLLEKALAINLGFLEARRQDPRARFDIARTQLSVARIHTMLGDDAAANTALVEADRLFGALGGESARSTAVLGEYANCLIQRAESNLRRGRAEDSVRGLDRSAAILKRLENDAPSDARWSGTLANVHSSLGRILRERDSKRALEEHRSAIAIHTSLVRGRPQSKTAQLALIIAHQEHGTTHLLVGSLDDAAAAFTAARTIWQRELENERGTRARTTRATIEQSLAWVALRRGKFATSRTYFESADAILTSLRDDFPRVPKHGARLAGLHVNRAEGLVRAGRLDESIEAVRQAVREWTQLANRFPGRASYRLSRGFALAKWSRIVVQIRNFGRPVSLDDAKGHARSALDIATQVQRDVGVSPEALKLASDAAGVLGTAHRLTDDVDDAAKAFERACQAGRELVALDEGVAPSWFRLGENLTQWGMAVQSKPTKAIAVLREGAQAIRRGREIDPRQVGMDRSLRDALHTLGRVCLATGDIDAASSHAEELDQLPQTDWLARNWGAQLLLDCANAVKARDEMKAARHAKRGLELLESVTALHDRQLAQQANRAWLTMAARTRRLKSELELVLGRGKASTESLDLALDWQRRVVDAGNARPSALRELNALYRKAAGLAQSSRDFSKSRKLLDDYAKRFRSVDDQFRAACLFARGVVDQNPARTDFARRALTILANVRDQLTRDQLVDSRLDALRTHADFRKLIEKRR